MSLLFHLFSFNLIFIQSFMCRPNKGYITLIVNRKLKKGGRYGNAVPRTTVEYHRLSMALTQYTL